MTVRRRLALGAVVMAAAIAVWSVGALRSPVLDESRRAEHRYVEAVLSAERPDEAAERAAAEAYWDRYPDVARDATFGRDGHLGIHGAREHYERHGEAEGRVWGID